MFHKHIAEEELIGTPDYRVFGCVADDCSFLRQCVESPWTTAASAEIASQKSGARELQQPNVRSGC